MSICIPKKINGSDSKAQNRVGSPFNGLLTASLKKWTCDPPMHRAFSRRQAFEAYVNRFALLSQVHGAKPVDHRRQQALIRSGQAGSVNPIDHLGVRHHPSAATLKEDVQDTVQTHLPGEGL